jgi:hypothetical protein
MEGMGVEEKAAEEKRKAEERQKKMEEELAESLLSVPAAYKLEFTEEFWAMKADYKKINELHAQIDISKRKLAAWISAA